MLRDVLARARTHAKEIAMKLNGIQILQFVAMIVAPIIIHSSLRGEDDGTATMASCVVVALLFVGVSICSVANAIQERNKLYR